MDLLAIVDGIDERFDPNRFSIYSYKRITTLWEEGNPFAWHLSGEAMMIFSSDRTDFLQSLGQPSPYREYVGDCKKFRELFEESRRSLMSGNSTTVFELSTMFLSIRNIATCYSLGVLGTPSFARDSALRLGPRSAPITPETFRILERSRIVCTRGQGEAVTPEQVREAIPEMAAIQRWMDTLVEEAFAYAGVQQQD